MSGWVRRVYILLDWIGHVMFVAVLGYGCGYFKPRWLGWLCGAVLGGAYGVVLGLRWAQLKRDRKQHEEMAAWLRQKEQEHERRD